MKQGYWLRRPPARWLPADGLRNDANNWLTGNPHWFRYRIKEDEAYVEEILKAKDILGAETAVHIYD